MPDLLFFLFGAFVTAIVGLAVWSIGLMDVDEPSGPEFDRTDSRVDGGR